MPNPTMSRVRLAVLTVVTGLPALVLTAGTATGLVRCSPERLDDGAWARGTMAVQLESLDDAVGILGANEFDPGDCHALRAWPATVEEEPLPRDEQLADAWLTLARDVSELAERCESSTVTEMALGLRELDGSVDHVVDHLYFGASR